MDFYNCEVFDMRAGDEHRSLTVDQFQLGVSANGTEYLEFTGHSTKTYTGGLKHHKLLPRFLLFLRFEKET